MESPLRGFGRAVVLAAAGSCIVAASTWPAPTQTPHTPASVLKRYDSNHNGVLDPAERDILRRSLIERLAEVRKQNAAGFDLNRDGSLDSGEEQLMKAERSEVAAKSKARALARYDANHDGELDAQEKSVRHADNLAWLRTKQAQILVAFDTNHDGSLDAAERLAIQARVAAARQEALSRYDSDGDGRLSSDERRAASEPSRHSRAIGGPPSLDNSSGAAIAGTRTIENIRAVATEAGTSIRVTFTLGVATPVSVTVFDAAGRVVQTVASEAVRPAGENELLWDTRRKDGHSVPNGLYFVRVSAFGSQTTRKVFLIR